MFDVQDPSNQDRLAMLEVGARIIAQRSAHRRRARTWCRVSTRMYRPDYAINPINPHLHNVPLQIAAERGPAGAGDLGLVRR